MVRYRHTLPTGQVSANLAKWSGIDAPCQLAREVHAIQAMVWYCLLWTLLHAFPAPKIQEKAVVEMREEKNVIGTYLCYKKWPYVIVI